MLLTEAAAEYNQNPQLWRCATPLEFTNECLQARGEKPLAKRAFDSRSEVKLFNQKRAKRRSAVQAAESRWREAYKLLSQFPLCDDYISHEVSRVKVVSACRHGT
jgi:hypothetical protein